jgi:DNA polymerase III subunit epsilon
MNRTRLWTEYPIVAFDTETSGAYPVGSDIVEFGAVKWFKGKEVDRLQMLIKPREPMGDFVIGIHGITNEMVENAPPIQDVINSIHEFMKDSIGMAHHAPFDMGFVAFEFERSGLPLLSSPVFCTSLLSRALIHGTENHKLQTLVKHLGIDGGAAHRAADDANACLHVGFKCLSILEECAIEKVLEKQIKKLEWPYYSLNFPQSIASQVIRDAILSKSKVEIIYDKGSKSGKLRPIEPLGIVRNPDGDYIAAICLLDHQKKRFYLQHLKEAAILQA